MTRIKQLLQESQIDPRAVNSPLTVIVDAVVSNPRYGEDRAIEMITEAKRTFDQPSGSPEVAAQNLEQYHRQMTNAISLLALSRAMRE